MLSILFTANHAVFKSTMKILHQLHALLYFLISVKIVQKDRKLDSFHPPALTTIYLELADAGRVNRSEIKWRPSDLFKK